LNNSSACGVVPQHHRHSLRNSWRKTTKKRIKKDQSLPRTQNRTIRSDKANNNQLYRWVDQTIKNSIDIHRSTRDAIPESFMLDMAKNIFLGVAQITIGKQIGSSALFLAGVNRFVDLFKDLEPLQGFAHHLSLSVKLAQAGIQVYQAAPLCLGYSAAKMSVNAVLNACGSPDERSTYYTDLLSDVFLSSSYTFASGIQKIIDDRPMLSGLVTVLETEPEPRLSMKTCPVEEMIPDFDGIKGVLSTGVCSTDSIVESSLSTFLKRNDYHLSQAFIIDGVSEKDYLDFKQIKLTPKLPAMEEFIDTYVPSVKSILQKIPRIMDQTFQEARLMANSYSRRGQSLSRSISSGLFNMILEREPLLSMTLGYISLFFATFTQSPLLFVVGAFLVNAPLK